MRGKNYEQCCETEMGVFRFKVVGDLIFCEEKSKENQLYSKRKFQEILAPQQKRAQITNFSQNVTSWRSQNTSRKIEVVETLKFLESKVSENRIVAKLSSRKTKLLGKTNPSKKFNRKPTRRITQSWKTLLLGNLKHRKTFIDFSERKIHINPIFERNLFLEN